MHLKALKRGCNGCFGSDHKNHLMKSRKYTLFTLKYTHPAFTAVSLRHMTFWQSEQLESAAFTDLLNVALITFDVTKSEFPAVLLNTVF